MSRRKDLVDILKGLEDEKIPLYYEVPPKGEFVRLASYDKPTGGPVRRVSVDEYLATRRGKVG